MNRATRAKARNSKRIGVAIISIYKCELSSYTMCKTKANNTVKSVSRVPYDLGELTPYNIDRNDRENFTGINAVSRRPP